MGEGAFEMRVYDLLLRVYPSSFRNEYGGEMRAVFARRRRDAVGAGSIVTLWLGTIAEVAGNAALVHGDLLRQDAGYTLRVLRRTPGFAITAVLIVALGIGATTAVFSVTDFVLIRPLPFPDPSRLVKVWERTPGYNRLELSAANYRDWTEGSAVFERIGMYHAAAANLLGAGEPLNVFGAAVSADLFPTLGVRPLLGRLFVETDDRKGAAGTLILSYRLWQTQFGGDPAVVGRELLLDSEKFAVVGVMPREFRFPSSDAQLWTPLRFDEQDYVDRNNNWLESVGRLRRGVTIAQARARLELLAAQSRRQYPKENADVSASVIRFSDEVSNQSRLLLVALCGAAGCVLLIACANLANLLLARALGRRRELAVRAAMGAGRERMIRQLMTESLLLAAIGGILGVLVARSAVPLLNRLVPSTLPLATAPVVDLRVLLFAMALTGVTGVAFGLAPVLRVGGEADLGGLRESARIGGGSRERLRSMLVVAEIVASVVLLVSAGLLLRALWTVQSTDPGFRAEGVLTLRTALPYPQYGKVATREAFYRRVLSDVRALPGVTSAGYISFQPLGRMRGGIWPVSLDGRPVNVADHQVAFIRYVTPGYFATLGIPMKSGRDVREADDVDRRPYAAVVSESFVRRYWPKDDLASVLGRHFTFAYEDRLVVGVVGDVRMRGLERDAEPQVYLSSKQVPDNWIIGYAPRSLAVRTTTPPAALAPSIRAIVRRVDPTLPVSDVTTLADLVDGDTASRSAQLRVIGAFAVIAFVLAGIGIHGLLSFAVSQRAQEIGVRVALGATRRDILSMVVGRCARLAVAGVIPGIAIAYVAGREMEALLAGVRPADATTMAAAVGLSIAMAAAGSLVPTLRALRVDPMTALRTE
jgi:putative ABC transport system permease protein